MTDEHFGTILTKIGKAKIANAALLGNNIALKTLKVGDSNGDYYDAVESQTKLKNELYSCEIGSIKIDKDNPDWVIVETMLPSNVGGFTIREVGICDADDNLIVVSKYPATYKPVVENGAGKEICVRLIIEVNNAEQITLNLNPDVIIATKEDINDLQNKINNNSSKLNEKTNNTDSNRTTAAKDVTGAINELNNKVGSCLARNEIKGQPLEIGKWIDFHKSGSNNDLDLRLFTDDECTKLYILYGGNGPIRVLDATNIINSLTAAEGGFVLDARQGKVLNDLISEIKGRLDNAGYNIRDVDLNTIIGVNRSCYTFNCTNVPKGLTNSYGFLNIRYFNGSEFILGPQTLQEFISYDNNKTYRRTYKHTNNTWSSWVTS